MSTSPPQFPTLTVGPVTFNADRPSIIVPVVASSLSASVRAIDAILASTHAEHIDVLEWRIDYLLDDTSIDQLRATLRDITLKLSGKRLLVTLRTAQEGGRLTISDEAYFKVVSQLAPHLDGHLIDVEYSRTTATQAIQAAQAHNVVVVGSFHDFSATPAAVHITAHLRAMVHAGVDIAKVAVMPNSPEDVLEALRASLHAGQKLPRPCMVISMGSLGAASRLSGGVFGSCATFATAGESSAPGQLPVSTVAQARAAIH